MAVITVGKIGVGHRDIEVYNGDLAATSTPALGEAVYFNSAMKLVKSNAGAAGTAKFAGIVVGIIDQAASFLKRGFCAGLDVSAMNIGDKLYLSDTAGALDTAAGTVSLVVGYVSVMGGVKLAYINADWSAL
jgi:hypothetical protein